MTKISKIQVNLVNRSYPIYIGNNLFSSFEKLIQNFSKYSKVIIISDNNVKKSINDFFFMLEKKLNKNILISTSMANLGFENKWKELGGVLYRTEVGDKFIYEEIINKKAYLGGEQSGHILSKINDFSGDGILTAIQIAKYCKRKNIKLKDWLRTSFLAFPQKLTNISLTNKINSSILERIDVTIEKTLSSISEPCRIFVRPSGTEPLLRVLVEAEDERLVKNCSFQLTKEIEKIINN